MDNNERRRTSKNTERKRRSASSSYKRRTVNNKQTKKSYSEERRYKVKHGDENFYNEESPFFKNSSISGGINVRTNRAEDYFENKDYTPWDKEDEFNKINSYKNEPRKIKKKEKSKKSNKKNIGNGINKLFSGNDEIKEDSITQSIKNTRNNKKLLDELNVNKKPLSKRQRKLKNFVLIGVIVGVIILVGLILSVTVLFKCENIKIEGTTRYSENDIINVSNLSYGENIFLANKSSASKRIEEKYPYIETAKIGFSVPNTITIKVTEAIPEYYIQDGTRFYIISKSGKLLEEVIKKELDIPNIIGCSLITPKLGEKAQIKDERIVTVLNEIASSMENNGVTGIREIDLSDMSNIELNYDDRITIVIGMPEYVDYKMRTAMTIILTKLSESDKGKLNCSNLVEGRTDNKDNASYFQPNHLVTEEKSTQSSIVQQSTQPVTEPLSQTEPVQEGNVDEPVEIEDEPVEIEDEEQSNEENYYNEDEYNDNEEYTYDDEYTENKDEEYSEENDEDTDYNEE